MPYTLGARHILSGTGSISIASPIGLKVAISGIPNYLSRNAGTPLEYFNLGSLVPGNADGSLPRVPLHHAAELVYPLPDSLTVLGYDLVAGATATVDELVAVAVPGALAMPWDRSPVAVALQAFQTYYGASSVNLWTYTVPAGRMLELGLALASTTRNGIASATGVAQVTMYRSGAYLLEALGYSNVLGETDTQQATDLLLLPGETLTASYFCNDTGGARVAAAVASGYTFLV